MFDETYGLSDDNKCAIHSSFSSNDNWDYDWDEYCFIHLPPETNDRTRLLIERVLIAVGCKIFPNNLSKEIPILDKHIELMKISLTRY